MDGRIQRKRSKGWKMPPEAVYIGRPSKYGNPYKIGKYERGRSIILYRDYLQQCLKEDPNYLEPLRGKILACWCKETELCHGDIILHKLADSQK